MSKKLEVSYEGKIFIVEFKDVKPRKTQVFDNERNEYFRMAKKLLRVKSKELGFSESGYLFNKSGLKDEFITHQYFRTIWNKINN